MGETFAYFYAQLAGCSQKKNSNAMVGNPLTFRYIFGNLAIN